jgi:hypothetical protein
VLFDARDYTGFLCLNKVSKDPKFLSANVFAVADPIIIMDIRAILIFFIYL